MRAPHFRTGFARRLESTRLHHHWCAMKITLCTLFEGHYHYGVAALANSLASAGYEGTLWVGHRGGLPAWIAGRRDRDGCVQVTAGLTLRTVALDPPMSLNYHKPVFMREILETHEPDSDAVVYLDPDVVVKCPWTTIEGWLAPGGIALVEDIDWCLPARHPKRERWREFFAARGETQRRALERYYNSGFVAVPRGQLDVLRTWQRVCELIVAEIGVELRQRKRGAPDDLFHSTDEDALNFALSTCHAPLNTCGPEAMDFAPGGNRFSHAVGAAKPWEGRHLRSALRGSPPSLACGWYYRFANGPLRPFSNLVLARRRLSMTLATALGRVYRRA
jgi:hypothetical protein